MTWIDRVVTSQWYMLFPAAAAVSSSFKEEEGQITLAIVSSSFLLSLCWTECISVHDQRKLIDTEASAKKDNSHTTDIRSNLS